MHFISFLCFRNVERCVGVIMLAPINDLAVEANLDFTALFLLNHLLK